MIDFSIGQEVYTEDGHKALFAGEIDGQLFVRVVLSSDDGEFGTEEWPSEKLTPVGKVYTVAPTEKYDARIVEAQERLSALLKQQQEARAAILELTAKEKEARATAAKFPQMQTALDFLEGRITHVVIEQYGAIAVSTLEDALTYREDGSYSHASGGMKLLCLFGFKKGKPPQWSINRYYDGSGNWTTIFPFTSEDEARAEIQRRADDAFAAWKIDGKGVELLKYIKAGAVIPQDFQDHIAAQQAKLKAEKVEKLRAEIAALEAAP